MRSIIFANYMARDTTRLSPTLEVEHHHVRFLGNLQLNLWDCGGQDAFYGHYFESQKESIFKAVEVLIYVFDVESTDIDKDMDQFLGVMEAVDHFSPDAKLFILIHKMDLITEDAQREIFFEHKKMEIQDATVQHFPALGSNLTFFQTSIWDETLYKAWSSIVYQLIPNVGSLEKNLFELCSLCNAQEVVLFEKATFLVISHASMVEHGDPHRFEKISNIVKQFKLSCGKTQAQFGGLEVANLGFHASMQVFTSNTYIMIVHASPDLYTASTSINVKASRAHFEAYIP